MTVFSVACENLIELLGIVELDSFFSVNGARK